MGKEQHISDNTYKPTMHGIQIQGKRGRLFAVLYTAGGKRLHPTVLLMNGIPGNEQNLDLAQELRRNGFHVMTFHYSGCFILIRVYFLSGETVLKDFASIVICVEVSTGTL